MMIVLTLEDVSWTKEGLLGEKFLLGCYVESQSRHAAYDQEL